MPQEVDFANAEAVRSYLVRELGVNANDALGAVSTIDDKKHEIERQLDAYREYSRTIAVDSNSNRGKKSFAEGQLKEVFLRLQENGIVISPEDQEEIKQLHREIDREHREDIRRFGREAIKLGDYKNPVKDALMERLQQKLVAYRDAAVAQYAQGVVASYEQQIRTGNAPIQTPTSVRGEVLVGVQRDYPKILELIEKRQHLAYVGSDHKEQSLGRQRYDRVEVLDIQLRNLLGLRPGESVTDMVHAFVHGPLHGKTDALMDMVVQSRIADGWSGAEEPAKYREVEGAQRYPLERLTSKDLHTSVYDDLRDIRDLMEEYDEDWDEDEYTEEDKAEFNEELNKLGIGPVGSEHFEMVHEYLEDGYTSDAIEIIAERRFQQALDSEFDIPPREMERVLAQQEAQPTQEQETQVEQQQQEAPSLWQRFKNFVSSIVERIRGFFSSEEKAESIDTQNARVIEEYDDSDDEEYSESDLEQDNKTHTTEQFYGQSTEQVMAKATTDQQVSEPSLSPYAQTIQEDSALMVVGDEVKVPEQQIEDSNSTQNLDQEVHLEQDEAEQDTQIDQDKGPVV